MSELISGKDAKLAWANGDVIEYQPKCDGWLWIPLGIRNPLCAFEDDRFIFRLKPRTITINGIEVPAPFEPKEGEVFYYINDYSEDGYDWVISCNNLFNNTVWIGKWRTEEEIKQVVRALRKLLNP